MKILVELMGMVSMVDRVRMLQRMSIMCLTYLTIEAMAEI